MSEMRQAKDREIIDKSFTLIPDRIEVNHDASADYFNAVEWMSTRAHSLRDLRPEVISIYIQKSAKVDAPGCVNAAGKLGRSDKQQQ